MKYMQNVSVNTIYGKKSYDSRSEKYATWVYLHSKHAGN